MENLAEKSYPGAKLSVLSHYVEPVNLLIWCKFWGKVLSMYMTKIWV